MQTITINIYDFDELSPAAKAKAKSDYAATQDGFHQNLTDNGFGYICTTHLWKFLADGTRFTGEWNV